MRIKELRCDQFAGLTDRAISFEKGLNIVVGPNECGKSTLIDLIYHLFFKDAVMDGRRDREFREDYFPKSTGEYQGDTIDGVVRFETEKGAYKLSKEWSGKDGTCRLTLPDGTTIRNSAQINEILAEILGYGRGIYDELIFESQKRTHTALRGIFNGDGSAVVEELSAQLTKAVMETGGVDIDKMGDRLDEIIAEYGGHWDFEADMPEGGRKRGINKPWKVGAGSIVKAYYDMETIAYMQQNAETAEKKVEKINADIRNKKLQRQELNETRKEFARVRGLIGERNNLKALIASDERELKAMSDALSSWPAAADGIEKARELRGKYRMSFLKALYDEVRLIVSQLENNKKTLSELDGVDGTDAVMAEKLQRTVERLEARLAGINLTAKIKPAGANEVTVTAEKDGHSLEGANGLYDISEAVNITVPGVVEIRLMPKGVNVEDIKSEITEKKRGIKALCGKCAAFSVEELKKKLEEKRRLIQQNNMFEERIANKLNGMEWEELQREAAGLPELLPAVNAVEAEIRALCGSASLEGFIGAREEKVREYTLKYESTEMLSRIASEKQKSVEKNKTALQSISEIPEQFSAISDPDAHEEELSRRIDAADEELEGLRRELSAAERSLGDKSLEEYSEEYRLSRADFEEKKSVCRHWMHIKEVFTLLRDGMKTNPMEDIERYFAKYLSALSGGDIRVESVEENLRAEIISKNHPLTYRILSEGTKDTISLGFRLAVLEHLYPEGGCIAVFDDPFTDMDPVRTKAACKLIQKFAEKNQVIFITCDEKYCESLTGNVISVS